MTNEELLNAFKETVLNLESLAESAERKLRRARERLQKIEWEIEEENEKTENKTQ